MLSRDHLVATRMHLVQGEAGADGQIAVVSDRTRASLGTQLTAGKAGAVLHSVGLSFADGLAGGSTAPGSGRMTSIAGLIRQLRNGDSFLELAGSRGGTLSMGRYTTVHQGKSTMGYVVFDDELRPGSVPAGGRATYRGNVMATTIGSLGGTREKSGELDLTADFSPSGGTVSGRMDGFAYLTRDPRALAADGYSLDMLPTTITGNGFSGESWPSTRRTRKARRPFPPTTRARSISPKPGRSAERSTWRRPASLSGPVRPPPKPWKWWAHSPDRDRAMRP